MITSTRTQQATKGAVEPMGARNAQAASIQRAMASFRWPQETLGGRASMVLGTFLRFLVSAEFHQARGYDLGQVAFFVDATATLMVSLGSCHRAVRRGGLLRAGAKARGVARAARMPYARQLITPFGTNPHDEKNDDTLIRCGNTYMVCHGEIRVPTQAPVPGKTGLLRLDMCAGKKVATLATK